MMLRKFISLLLLTSLLAVVVAGCGPGAAPSAPSAAAPAAGEAAAAPSGEVVTLDYYWIGNGDTDQRSLVEAAINEYVEPLIGVNVVFHIIGWGDWETKALTAIQSGEKIDIFFTADWKNYMQLASQDLFLPLNDDAGENGNMLEQYGPDILAGLNPAFITGTQIDGVNYAVPTNKELTVPEGFVYNSVFADEIGFTEEEAAKVKTLQDLEPWLEKAKAARPNESPYLTDGRVAFMPWVPGLVTGVDDKLIGMKFAPDENGVFDETIVSVMETEWAQEYTAVMRDWYTKGWIHPDAGLTTFNADELMNAGKFFIRPAPLKGNNIKAQELVNASGNPDLQLKEIYGQPKINITVHSGGSMLAIPAISEHPVEAMKYINLMHSDSTLLNMMLFGVEGTHWEFEDDGRVNILNPAWYGAHGGAWTLGNTMLQAVSNKENPDKNRLLIEYSNDAIDHASLGFRFRTDPVAAELTAVNAIAEGTMRALMTGYVDPATELPKFISGLKAAGFDTVKTEVETQYEAWKATRDR
ncbi:MAG: ABC transporter substrate-binding protein [Caldilineaceae bacterium]|nr:ABC transporter substrate-binding protein [Caldilineaceae bacterium]